MKIEKINVKDLPLELFMTCYFNKKPIVITGIVEEWGISGETLKGFSDKYGDRVVPVRGSRVNDFDQYMEVNIRHYIENMKKNPEKWYCDFTTDFENMPEIKNLFNVPLYFKNGTTSIKNGLLYEWVYLGGGGTGTPLHQDVDHSHAWNGLIIGEKDWIVFHKDEEISEEDKKRDWLKEKHLNTNKKYIKFKQKPNELVYIPSDFWHQVENIKDSLCITGNFWECSE